MNKKLLFPLILSVVLCHAYGLRTFEIGEKIPETPATSVFKPGTEKVILIASSQSEKCADFLKAWVECNNTVYDFFFVDTSGTLDSKSKEIFENIKSPKTHIPDKPKQLYGDLGVIVMPTMLFINTENTLHSFIAGKKPNLGIFMSKNLKALKENKAPGDIFEELNEKKANKLLNQKLNQAFKMMLSENYSMSEMIYKKAIVSTEDNLEAVLGYSYCKLLNGDVLDKSELSDAIKQYQDNPRVQFLLSFESVLSNPNDESLEAVSRQCRVESKFFNVVFFTGELLEKNGKTDKASFAYKHAYKLLWNTYRRGR